MHVLAQIHQLQTDRLDLFRLAFNCSTVGRFKSNTRKNAVDNKFAMFTFQSGKSDLERITCTEMQNTHELWRDWDLQIAD